MQVYHTTSYEETQTVAAAFAKGLRGGDVVCMSGDLGAGKTAFTGGVARGLGVDGPVTSPTFTIVNEYDGDLVLYHFDVYRVHDADDLMDIGFEEYLAPHAVTVIEWAELIRPLLPETCWWVDIRSQGLPEGHREIRVTRGEEQSA